MVSGKKLTKEELVRMLLYEEVEAFNAYRVDRFKARQSEPIDLREVNLRGVRLGGIDFCDTDLRDSDLSDVDFSSSARPIARTAKEVMLGPFYAALKDIGEGNQRQSDLSNADLSRAKLKNVN